MKPILKLIFTLILLLMIGVTFWSSLEKNVWEGFVDVFASRWATATLADAYCGFLTFYCWVFYKRTSWLARAWWFVVIMIFGNIGMSLFMLRELSLLKNGEGVEALLLRRPAQT